MSEFDGTARHLSGVELRLWTSLLDASRILETEIERQLAEHFDMTHREYEVLVRVDGGGGHMRMAELARRIECSRALVTQTVNRLVERGWVERQQTPGDRRGVAAALTSEGRAALAEASGPHAELIRRLLLAPIPTSGLDAAADALHVVAEHLRDHRAGTPCSDPTCPLNP